MSEHTPRPWYVQPGFLTIYACEGLDTAGCGLTQAIASMNTSQTPQDEAEANARLIAAAPDLLAAAERACKMLDQEFDDRVANIETTRAFLVLQDAISKARGTDDA